MAKPNILVLKIFHSWQFNGGINNIKKKMEGLTSIRLLPWKRM